MGAPSQNHLEATEQTHVFISYSRKDAEPAGKVVRGLEERGIKVWLDTSDIHGGESWRASLSAAITDASHVIVLLSHSSVWSEQVGREIIFAADRGRPIVPVIIGRIDRDKLTAFGSRNAYSHAMAFILAGLQVIDMVAEPFPKALTKLLEALSTDQSLDAQTLTSQLNASLRQRHPYALREASLFGRR